MKQKYAVVFEQPPSNYSAYVPDLPGCVSTGESLEDTHRTIREAITFHIVDMLAHGEPLPEPRMSLEQADDLHNDVLAEYGGDTSAVFHDVELKLQRSSAWCRLRPRLPCLDFSSRLLSQLHR